MKILETKDLQKIYGFGENQVRALEEKLNYLPGNLSGGQPHQQRCDGASQGDQ